MKVQKTRLFPGEKAEWDFKKRNQRTTIQLMKVNSHRDLVKGGEGAVIWTKKFGTSGEQANRKRPYTLSQPKGRKYWVGTKCSCKVMNQ